MQVLHEMPNRIIKSIRKICEAAAMNIVLETFDISRVQLKLYDYLGILKINVIL